jgi:Protein of unknown function with HXXEE motif
MPPLPLDRLGQALLFAPVIFIIHFLEESPTFVPWFNGHVTPDITQDTFWSVNVTGLLITGVLTLGFWTTRSTASILLMVAWLSFLMLTNAIFHLIGALVDRTYVPGLISAIVLYLPYCAWVLVRVVHSRPLRPGLVGLAVVLGGIPMAVHGYRILFLGTRLF